MKKLLLVGLTTLSLLGLSACGAKETQYNYNDFNKLVTERNLVFSVTKATVSIQEGDQKTEKIYTYNAKDKVWESSYVEEILGQKVTMNEKANLDIYSRITTLGATDIITEFLGANAKVDDYYKFYATDNSYRVTFLQEDDESKTEGEEKFGKDGLLTYSYSKTTVKATNSITETKETYKYSK